MFVSGVVATASLVGVLILLGVGGVLLAYVDSSFNKQRAH